MCICNTRKTAYFCCWCICVIICSLGKMICKQAKLPFYLEEQMDLALNFLFISHFISQHNYKMNIVTISWQVVKLSFPPQIPNIKNKILSRTHFELGIRIFIRSAGCRFQPPTGSGEIRRKKALLRKAWHGRRLFLLYNCTCFHDIYDINNI